MVLVAESELGFWIGDNTSESINLFSGQLSGYPQGVLAMGGNDTVQGVGDAELIIGNQGNDNLLGGSGNDTLFGGKDNDVLEGQDGNDGLFGNLGQDTVTGGAGNDNLFGGRDNDALIGDGGNDTISGDLGADTLTGGAGADWFSVSNDGQGADLITDFQDGTDLIQVPNLVTAVQVETNALNQAVITVTATGEVLATLDGIQAEAINRSDFVGGQVTVTAATSGGTDSSPDAVFINRVLELTNDYRAQNAVSPLTLNAQLINAAETHSENMAVQDFFSHTGADGSSVGDRAQAAGYSSSFLGENIAAGYSTPESVVAGWINSSGHRANILNANFTELGVGYAYLDNDLGTVNYNSYWTQVFGAV
ncbi:MAG: CAP domain-containing protein [Microcoleaceae cyanobacterium]